MDTQIRWQSSLGRRVKKRKTYTCKFKIEAVQLSAESDRPIIDVANGPGIHPNTLYKWRKQLLEDGEEAFPGHGKMKASDEEVRRLWRELARAREERDILKKAIVFFAREGK